MPALPSYKLLLFSDHPIISFPYVANLYSYIGAGKRLNYVDIIGHPGEKKGEAPSHGLFSHVSLLLYYSTFRIRKHISTPMLRVTWSKGMRAEGGRKDFYNRGAQMALLYSVPRPQWPETIRLTTRLSILSHRARGT